MTNKSIEKYYRYAKSIAGEQGEDLFHHVFLDLPDKMNYPDSYVWTCLWNSYHNKLSTYNLQNNPKFVFDVPEVEEVIELCVKYDSLLLHKILLQMEIEGYNVEVKVYKDCTLNSNISAFSKKAKLNARTITKICNFVEQEIRIRYALLDN